VLVSVQSGMSLVACPIYVDNLIKQFKMLSWNVRGLNSCAKQEDVKQIITIIKPDILCLQETKMESLMCQPLEIL
jgi:endonuclease/exonuclease/phosphatase family metal-dependent hydrolase